VEPSNTTTSYDPHPLVWTVSLVNFNDILASTKDKKDRVRAYNLVNQWFSGHI